MKTTRYFEWALQRRPEIRREWCEDALARPLETKRQENGWMQMWTFVPEVGKYLRIIVLDDGETVHNAFFDRGFARRR